MTSSPEFAFLRLSELRLHEEIEEKPLRELIAHIERTKMVTEPIWVARGTFVVLNGHHRVEALRRLGAERAPAWVFDYESDLIHLERWQAGPPIAKSEVIRRAMEGHPFPPKTTRHRLQIDLPSRPTRLSELLPRPARPGRAHSRASVRS